MALPVLPAFLQRIKPIHILLILVALWTIIQVSLFLVVGIKTPVDTEAYVEDAMRILNGHIPQGRTFWYLGYSGFLALVFLLKGSLREVVFLQVLFTGIASVSIYSIANQVYNNKNTAFLAAFLYIVWIKIHQWNFFIYTESFFTSLCIINFALLLKCKKPWHYALLTLPLVVTFLVRPTGFSFFVGIACYFMSGLVKYNIKKKVYLTVLALIAIGGVLLLNKMLEHHILIESYLKAEIIYPNISLGVDVPANLTLPKQEYPQLLRMVLFMVLNPLYFLKISFIKFFLFVGNVKPYFSVFHNLLIIFILWPLYYFAYRGLRYAAISNKARFFLAGIIFSQIITVTLTTENWDGRFLITILPFVFILSAIGITQMLTSNQVLQEQKK